MPSNIIYVKLSNGDTTKLIPYSEYKENPYKYNKYISSKFVVLNVYLDEFISAILYNLYSVDVKVDILKYIGSRVSKREFMLIQSAKDELLTLKKKYEEGEIDKIVIDLKKFGNKGDRFYTGITDLISLIESTIFPEETLGIKIVYSSKFSFVIEIVSEKGFEFLYKTLCFMQTPLLVNSYLFSDDILKLNDELDNEITNFAYRIYKKWKLGAVATSLGYNPRNLYYVFDILQSGTCSLTIEDLTYDKLFLLFLAGNKIINSFNEYVRNQESIKLLFEIHKRVFGNNIFEVDCECSQLVA